MNERQIIQPRTLKGFRDFLPGAMRARDWLLDTAREVFRSYGYSPIDTPALEYTEILLGKGGDESDKQLYRFEDNGGRDIALRFDLTVPLARFAAQHINELGTPFKRYHIGPVWRGENTQRGRYREFMQCDFDFIGTTSMTADTETALVIHDVFDALDIGEFTIKINNRKVLSGILESLGLADATAAVLRAIDKLAKVGNDKVIDELRSGAGASTQQAEELLATVGSGGDNAATLRDVAAMGNTAAAGAADLEQVISGLEAAGVDAARINVDTSIARGLDYYTGTVYETFLDEMPDIGSVCSGGRYDDLASLYTKQQLPGVGASIGIDRLLAALEDLGRVDLKDAGAPILLTMFTEDRAAAYVGVAADLRRSDLDVELYPEAKKLGAQLKYADRKGHTLAIIIGEDEWAAGTAQIKVMATGEAHVVEQTDLATECKRLLEATE